MGTIDGLPPLREVIAAHDLAAKKSLGQNFILDLNLTSKIARLAGDLTACDVLEVGPGPISTIVRPVSGPAARAMRRVRFRSRMKFWPRLFLAARS